MPYFTQSFIGSFGGEEIASQAIRAHPAGLYTLTGVAEPESSSPMMGAMKRRTRAGDNYFIVFPQVVIAVVKGDYMTRRNQVSLMEGV